MKRSTWVAWGLAFLVTACGGGGGGSDATTSSPSAAGSGSSVSSGSSQSAEGISTSSGNANTTGDAGTTPSSSKSSKRGIAYDLASEADLAALAPGLSWWYNWSPRPSNSLPTDAAARHAVDFIPMLWNGTENVAALESYLHAHPEIKHLLVLNEPNLNDQANLTPPQAAQRWPVFEGIASRNGVKIVGPAITWGTQANYQDPVTWLDAFHAAYRAANGNRNPRIDALAFHWYDYGLNAQLERLKKYGKPFWVTEFANWHASSDGAQIDSLAKQKAQMADMVAVCESRDDVLRYAWFTGRWSPDPHHTSLLGANGQLTELGAFYLSLPH